MNSKKVRLLSNSVNSLPLELTIGLDTCLGSSVMSSSTNRWQWKKLFSLKCDVLCCMLLGPQFPPRSPRIYLVLHFHILSFRAAPLQYPFSANCSWRWRQWPPFWFDEGRCHLWQVNVLRHVHGMDSIHEPLQYNEFAPLAKILPVHQTFVRRRPDIAFRLQSSLRYQGGNLNGQARCFNLHPSPWLIICRCRLSRLLWILSVDYPCGFRTPLLRPRSWGTWIFDCRPQTCNSNQMPARPGHAMWSEPRLARMRRTPQSLVLL